MPKITFTEPAIIAMTIANASQLSFCFPFVTIHLLLGFEQLKG